MPSDLTLDAWRALLRVGVQWNSEVTLDTSGHCVTQVYCSAVPVAYSRCSSAEWEPLARLVLEAAYEATLAVGVLNAASTGNNTVYLTALGGGAFGNNRSWIDAAIDRALTLFAGTELDVVMVSFGR